MEAERKRGRPPAKTDTVIELGDNLTRIIELMLTTNHEELQELIGEIMSAIDTLRTAVNTLNTTAIEGFAAMSAGFEELAADIAALPGSADVEAEAARISATATDLGTLSAAFAQRLRDALPTAAPEEPLPPVEEEVPAPPNPEEPTEPAP